MVKFSNGNLKKYPRFAFFAFFLIFLNYSYFFFTKCKLFDFGARGVEIFFVLSGFLMAFNYGDKDVDFSWKASTQYMLQKVKNFDSLHLATFALMACYFLI